MTWTEERRKRQAEICRQNKPWLKSTRSKTLEGKSKVSLNARKHKEQWHESAAAEHRAIDLT